MIEQDLVECVIGLGPNLFYNSPMEACLLITKINKPASRKGKILFINAVNEVKQEKNIGFLEEQHINKIFKAYQSFTDKENFAALMTIEDVLAKKGNMAINLYVRPNTLNLENSISFDEVYQQWNESADALKSSIEVLFKTLTAL